FSDELADIVGSMGFIGTSVTGVISRALIAGYASQGLRNVAGRRQQAFSIDFRTDPPTWQSTSDRHWRDVMVFFGLAAPPSPAPPPLPPGPSAGGSRLTWEVVLLIVFG